jgi:predicted PP-loop superfamily ATPase
MWTSWGRESAILDKSGQRGRGVKKGQIFADLLYGCPFIKRKKNMALGRWATQAILITKNRGGVENRGKLVIKEECIPP